MRASPTHWRILSAMAQGWTLKSHRSLDGTKVYRLQPLNGPPEALDRAAVEYLLDHGLIDSNKKFPVATYWLTEKGKAWLATRAEPGRHKANAA